jgi:formamidopyrimidine-DNA glycosylase
MPELPEVETLARSLRAAVLGEVIRGVEIRWRRTVATPAPEALPAAILGRRITAVARRAKFLVFTLAPVTADDPAGAEAGDRAGGAVVLYLVAHLRMTGQFLLADGPQSPLLRDPHAQLVFYLSSGRALCFHDVRKFGRVWALRDAAPVLGELGLEPLAPEFTTAALAGLLEGAGGRSNRCSSISGWWPAWAISMWTNRSGRPASTPCGAPIRSHRPKWRGCTPPSARC